MKLPPNRRDFSGALQRLTARATLGTIGVSSNFDAESAAIRRDEWVKGERRPFGMPVSRMTCPALGGAEGMMFHAGSTASLEAAPRYTYETRMKNGARYQDRKETQHLLPVKPATAKKVLGGGDLREALARFKT